MTYLLYGYDKATNYCQYKAAVPEKNTEDLKRLLSVGYEVVTAEQHANAVIWHEQDSAPTQLDIIEAQVTYTAMITGTLIGG